RRRVRAAGQRVVRARVAALEGLALDGLLAADDVGQRRAAARRPRLGEAGLGLLVGLAAEAAAPVRQPRRAHRATLSSPRPTPPAPAPAGPPSRRTIRRPAPLWTPRAAGPRRPARLWLPEDAEADPVPAILEYLPYRKGDAFARRDSHHHAYFAGFGYAGV